MLKECEETDEEAISRILIEEYIKDDEYLEYPRDTALNRFIQDMFEKLGGKIEEVKSLIFIDKFKITYPDVVLSKDELKINESLKEWVFSKNFRYQIAYDFHNIEMRVHLLITKDGKEKVRIRFRKWNGDY